MYKAVLLVCAQALFIQSIAGQCIGAGRGWGAPLAGTAPYGLAAPLAGGCGSGVAAIPASSGGGLDVSSASPISPNGLSVLSENAIEGGLAVVGALPFLGAVALDGVLPTAGAGAVNYGCGNGAVTILEEITPEGIAGSLGNGLGSYAAIDGIGYGGLGYGGLGNGGLGYGGLGYGIESLAGLNRAGCGCGGFI
ncbi:chorion class B protein M2807-like [Vanessa cardui]|uniref:chorion class B protein M2807-like n=1 Tax=Vanessa cardui TaxID=171605 RepID=UPI001F12C2ED|nr:chorion class B protein M2807-like [Vanessa cardui]